MSLTTRLFIAFGLVACMQLAVVAIHHGTDLALAPVPKVGPRTLPDTVGDFVGHDEPLDARTLAVANADAMINRVYENRLGDSVIVNVGIWVEYGKGIPHAPDLCYPSAGWEIANRDDLIVKLNDSHSLRTKQFIFQRDASRVAVVYWVHLGADTVIAREEIRPILQRLRGTGGTLPPLVKVMLHTEADDLDQARARLTRFVAALEPYTQAIH